MCLISPSYMLSCFRCVQLFATPWIVDCQAPLSMGFSRQEYWSRFLFPSPGDLPDPGIQPKFFCISIGRFFGSDGKASAYNVGDPGLKSLGQEDPLEKEMATHSSTLAWEMPWMEEPGGLQSMGMQRVRHDRATKLPLSFNTTREALYLLVQFSSVAQSCLTLCNPMDCSKSGLPVHHQLLELFKLKWTE